jgi:hypothetical protein
MAESQRRMNIGDLLRGAPLPATPEYERWREISRCHKALGEGVAELLRERPVLSHEERLAKIEELENLQGELRRLKLGKKSGERY